MRLPTATELTRTTDPQPRAVGVPTLWGLTLSQLHDRWWAARGLQVIRPGGREPEENGPELFLLMGRGLLVDFPLRRVLKRLAWMNPKAARFRLLEQVRGPYGERVLREPDGRFLAFKRAYGRAGTESCQLWITPSIELARVWRSASRGVEAASAVRGRVSQDQYYFQKLSGRIFDTDDPESVERYRRYIMEQWQDPATVVEGVYQPSPGVWIHESCQIHDRARIIGPVWMGAGHTLGAGQTLVGPAIVPDEPLIYPNPGPVDWHAATHSGWKILPSITRRPLRNVTKRLFDIVFSLGVLTVTLPLYPAIMLLIVSEDGGNPFFVHRRQRFGGRPFGCIKFRTMIKGAEAQKPQLADKNMADGPHVHIENDPRRLKCGEWMRKYKIDELPQFLNVLMGDMSIVGPRPSPEKENQFCPAWREARLSVRPGITGLWQVSSDRMPQTDFQQWIKYDLEYVQKNSWRLDLAILAATARKLLGK